MPVEVNNIVDECMDRLLYLEPYVYHKALTGSVYIKFKDERIGSLRIADHPGRKKYKYRWNLCIDYMHESESIHDRGTTRWFYIGRDLYKMLRHIENYANVVKKSDKLELIYE